METDLFRDEDTDDFLRLAADEGWVSDQWEIEFLRRASPQGCLVKRILAFPMAFVTTVRYERSGWLGNLLVHPALRRRGIGSKLLTEAITSLEQAEIETLWLTASPSGKPLYEQLGFRGIDRIDRWLGEDFAITPPPKRHDPPEWLKELDAAGWGDRRDCLMTALAEEGDTLIGRDSFLMTRSLGGVRQIGPWGGTAAEAAALFERSVALVTNGERICLDVPKGNELESFLERRGLKKIGTTTLMYRGATPAYRPELIGACAGMGSMG